MSIRILKEGGDSVVEALYYLFARSLKTGIVPEDWKLANVTPVFKKGSRKLLKNYRPISLTSLVCKVLEKITKGWIQKHLDANDILRTSLHGFRSSRSCLTNLLPFLNCVTEQLDDGEPVD